MGSSFVKCIHCNTLNWLRDENNLVYDPSGELICGYCIYLQYVIRVIEYPFNGVPINEILLDSDT